MNTQNEQTIFTVQDYINEYMFDEQEEITSDDYQKIIEEKEFGDIDTYSCLRKDQYCFIFQNNGQVPSFELDEQLEYADTKIFFETEMDDEDISFAYELVTNPAAKFGGYATFVKLVKISDWEKLELIDQAKKIVDKIGSWDQALAFAGVEVLRWTQAKVGKMLEKDRSTIRRNYEKAKKNII